MAGVLGVVQIIGIVYYTLDVALIVADFHSCLENVFLLFHIH